MSGGLQLIVTGAGVLFLLLVFPGGLGEVGLRIRRFGLDLIARRRGLTDGGPPADELSLRTGAGVRIDPADSPDVGRGPGRPRRGVRPGALGSRRPRRLPVGPGPRRRLRIAAGAVRRRFRRPPRRGRGPARHQRRREVHAGAGVVGPHPGPARDGDVRRARRHRRKPRAPRPPRDRPRARRARRLPRSHGGGEPPAGHVDVPLRQAALRRGHRTRSSSCSRFSANGPPSPPGCCRAASSRCWPWPRRWRPSPGC